MPGNTSLADLTKFVFPIPPDISINSPPKLPHTPLIRALSCYTTLTMHLVKQSPIHQGTQETEYWVLPHQFKPRIPFGLLMSHFNNYFFNSQLVSWANCSNVCSPSSFFPSPVIHVGYPFTPFSVHSCGLSGHST